MSKLRLLKEISIIKTILYNLRIFQISKPKLIVAKSVIMHMGKGINMQIRDRLYVGLKYYPKNKTVFAIGEKSNIVISGKASIGNGCRITVAKNATFKMGNNSYINENSRVMVNPMW
ncbi:MAG: hypothetical protein GX275_13775 [Clostridiales bacterium]|nr:hypothetical protein [Clostridiales bacterium]